MIKNTFLMLDGVGEKTERLLWEQGILSWEDFLTAMRLPQTLMDKKNFYEETLIYFLHELQRNNARPFAEFLPKKDHWRLYRHFKDNILCIDIETNGLPVKAGGEITVVGLFNGRNFKQFIKGVNLDEGTIASEFDSSKMIISFYGSVFDIPFLGKNFSALNNVKIPHFDLCFASRRAGLSGGLKKIETLLGLQRDSNITDLKGYDAVHLWRKWENGDGNALDALLSYNKADTVNLLTIADIIFQKLYKISGFKKYYEKRPYG